MTAGSNWHLSTRVFLDFDNDSDLQPTDGMLVSQESQQKVPMVTPMPGRTAELPVWYPPWALRLAELYFSGTTCLFVVHGNVHDLVRCPVGDGETYCNLTEFLSTQVFGSWDVVVQYDLARGLR